MDESVTLSNSVSEAHLPSVRSFLSDSALELKRREDRASASDNNGWTSGGGGGDPATTTGTGNSSGNSSSSSSGGGHIAGSGRAAVAAAIHARAAAATAASHGSSKRGGSSSSETKKEVRWEDGDESVVDSDMLRRAVSSLVAGHFVLPDGKLLVAKVFLGNNGPTGECQIASPKKRERTGSATGSGGDGGSGDEDSDDDDDGDVDYDSDKADVSKTRKDLKKALMDDLNDDGSNTSEEDEEEENGNYDNFGGPDAAVRPKRFPGYDSVYKLNQADPKQRSWHVFR